MEDETTPVGNPGPAAGDGQSSGGGGQQSVDLTAIQKRLDSFEAMVKGLQKGTDKVNARVEERVNERVNSILSSSQIGRIAELATAGKSSEEIENQLLLEEILAERKGKAPGAADGNPRAGGGSEGTAILKGIAEVFGLDANDAAVAEALSKGDSAALANIAKAKLTVPEPDGSTQPPLTPKQPPSPNAAKEIEDGYRADLAKVPRGNTHQVSMVKAKWRKIAREKGLQLNV